MNNLWLNKKVIKTTLNGLNMQVMRGEKIPMLLLDVSARHNIATYASISPFGDLIEDGCGWFIIKDLAWIYSAKKELGGTGWTTELTLTRREWPIQGYTPIAQEDGEDVIQVTNQLSEETTKASIVDSNVNER